MSNLNLSITREDLGMSQTDLAQRLGVTPSWVSKLESRPQEELRLGPLARWAAALGLELRVELVPRGGGGGAGTRKTASERMGVRA
jgi:transcriptional regulator with XRE-family HTH domain